MGADCSRNVYTIHARLLQKQEECGGYIVYVFEDTKTLDLNMVTRLPRWDCPFLKVGDTGFLQFQEVIAGESTWYDRTTGQRVAYRYDADYLLNFILDKPQEETLIL